MTTSDWELERPEISEMERIMTEAARGLMMDFVEEAWITYGHGDEPINPMLQLILVEYFMHHDTDLGEEVTHKEVYHMFHLLDWVRHMETDELMKVTKIVTPERLENLRKKVQQATFPPSRDFNNAAPPEHEGPHYDHQEES